MATQGGGTDASVDGPESGVSWSGSEYAPLAQKLYARASVFDFFQAVRLLARGAPARQPVGEGGPPNAEIVRFRVHNTLTFPPSSIQKLEPATADVPVPVLTVNFLGLTGPAGVLPRHYTELIERMVREADNPERYVMRDWFDIFNHRFISLFWRAWAKYRFWLPFDRGDHLRAEPDLFTRMLFSLIGMGTPGLRDRLRVTVVETVDDKRHERVLAKVNDFALLHYGGLLAHRPRCADSLEALLEDYFELPIRVQQLVGQWLQLTPDNQSRLGEAGQNNELGLTTVAGTRVWDVEGKIGLRIGPLDYEEYVALLPDPSAVVERKRFFLLVQMARLYVGPQFNLEVQLVLKRDKVPDCRLPLSTADGLQLGWNAWIFSQSLARDPDETVFQGDEMVTIRK